MRSTPHPSRKKLRLAGYQYNFPGYYHIVMVTDKRAKLLGDFVSGGLISSNYGKIIEDLLVDFSEHNPGVEIVKYQIMPDHLHLLIHLFEGESFEDPPSVSSIVSKIKTLSVWKYNNNPETRNRSPLPRVVWQRSYYDHILRTDEEACFTFDYIDFNPDQKSNT